MVKIEYRVVIKFFTKQGKSVPTILNEMSSVYGDSCPGNTMNANTMNTLMRLRPFVDDIELIRLGGRLSNAALDYAQTHPVILPRNDHVVNMIIEYYHVKYLIPLKQRPLRRFASLWWRTTTNTISNNMAVPRTRALV